MSTQASNAHSAGGTRLFLRIWIYLLALTGLEVFLADEHWFSPEAMLFILMAISLVKAALIVAYFMHLKFERRTLLLSLVPVVVMISLLFVFFTDSFRLLDQRVR